MDQFMNLPEHQKVELTKWIEEQQAKDSLKMYNNLVEQCFDKCVLTGWGGGFSTKNLSETENKCISVCSEKFMKVTQRMGFRLQEYQFMKQQQQFQEQQQQK
eukprot:gene14589-16164_t